MLAQAECGPKFRVLVEKEKINQSLVNKCFVLIDQWGQEVQLVIYEANIRNFEGLCLALLHLNKGDICESY